MSTFAPLTRPRFMPQARSACPGATIGGQLDCGGAQFENAGGYALNAERMKVDGSFLWQKIVAGDIKGRISLAAAHVGDLVDDPESWPVGKEQLQLDGFTYDRIGNLFTDAKRRLAWLEKGTRHKGIFLPQPYTQLAKVLRQMGHDREARSILEAQGTLLRRQWLREAKAVRDAEVFFPWRACQLGSAAVRAIWHFLEWLVVGYGHKPYRSLWALSALFIVATVLASVAWNKGSFAPNSDVVIVSQGWADLVALDCVPAFIGPCRANPAADWSSFGQQGLDWDTFNRYGYAADLVIPVLDLGQTDAWAPSKDRGFWGSVLWWGRWVLESLGWLVTALGVAALSGIMQRNGPGA